MIEEKELQRNGVAVDVAKEWLRDVQTAEERPDGSRDSIDQAEFAPLFESNVAEQLRDHWLEIQSRFVDDPNVSLMDADELVTNVIENIISTFAEKRMDLENQGRNGDKVSTEDLRIALKKYRAFFYRLLSLEY